MKNRLLIPAMAAMTLFAVPAMAQGFVIDRDGTVPVTGAQLTDSPSIRANTTIGDSFLRPKGYETRTADASYITHRDYTLGVGPNMRSRDMHSHEMRSDRSYRDGFREGYRRGASDYDR